MSVYKIKLVKKETVAQDTMAFHFQKPNDFQFEAGQYADYTLINPSQTDNEGDTRSFTLAYAPYEDDIVFITRMRDTAFKRVVRDMAIGTEVKFEGPKGDLVLKQNESPAVFITGGVGITPALSIVKQATHDAIDQKIILFYSNKTVNSAVAMDEFYKLADINSNFKFVPVITDQSPAGFTGEIGHINGDMLKRYVSDLSQPYYYLTGPPAMVKALRQVLIDNDIKKRNIFTEYFIGY